MPYKTLMGAVLEEEKLENLDVNRIKKPLAGLSFLILEKPLRLPTISGV
jgi:hypothetical protein